MGAWTVLPRLVVEAAVIVTFRSSYEYVGIGGNRGHLQQKKALVEFCIMFCVVIVGGKACTCDLLFYVGDPGDLDWICYLIRSDLGE